MSCSLPMPPKACATLLTWAGLTMASFIGCGSNETTGPCCSCSAPAEVFSRSGVHSIDFTLTADALTAIDRDDRPEVHASMDFDGTHFPDIGLRLKGSGSYQKMSGKPAFNIDMNKWIRGTKIDGLKAFRLHNGLAWDPTLTHEWLSYELARASGILAPRIGFAEVRINGQLFGVYVLAEKHDDVLIAHRDPLQKDTGVILEPMGLYKDLGIGALDLDGERLIRESCDEGPDPMDSAVIAAVMTADAILAGEPSEAAAVELWNVVDHQKFLDYLAWEAIVEHTDGYRAGSNWRLFIDGPTCRIEWVASGADSTWCGAAGSTDLFLVRQSPNVCGRALRFCLSVPSCRRDYAERILTMADRVESLDLAARYDELSEMLDPCIQADPKSPFDALQFLDARTATATKLTGLGASVKTQVHQEYPDLAP